jgi:hypothetical protein
MTTLNSVNNFFLPMLRVIGPRRNLDFAIFFFFYYYTCVTVETYNPSITAVLIVVYSNDSTSTNITP